jgi:hypothetical protein
LGLVSKRFKKTWNGLWHLICKAFWWLGLKRVGEVEGDLEGIVVAVLEGIREAGVGSGAR